MTITGLEEVQQLLAHLAQLPDRMESEAKANATTLRVAESTRGLYTQHRAGRRICAVTLPAAGMTAWISVLDPQRGTSRGGSERKRFPSREAALDYSRKHTLVVAEKLADRLSAQEARRALAQIDQLLQAL